MPPDPRPAAPRLFTLPTQVAAPVLALGGQSKPRLALAFGNQLVLSAELGDLAAPAGIDHLEAQAAALQAAHGITAAALICDAHAGYTGARWAKTRPRLPTTKIFHHHAHASAIAGEFPAEKSWLCFTWDGAGLGTDGTQWGGEAFLGAPGAWARVATFRPFSPPGGDKAAREPWRAAAALAWPLNLPFAPPGAPQLHITRAAWSRQIDCPPTSAVGRLFEAAAALLDLVHYAETEAQGPIALESLAGLATVQPAIHLTQRRRADGILQADWAPLVAMLTDETRLACARAYAFHASLAAALVAQAAALRDTHPPFAVGLTGGVFQNRLLAGLVRAGLRRAGLRAYLPAQLPCHDGALAFGQVIEATAL